jgi:hypothetical protein
MKKPPKDPLKEKRLQLLAAGGERLRLADFPEFIAVEEKRQRLLQAIAEMEQRRDALVNEMNDQSLRRRAAAEQARELLDGRPLEELGQNPTDKYEQELKTLRQRLHVAKQALQIHDGQDAVGVISRCRQRIREAAEPFHKALARRVGEALDALVQACLEEETFRDRIRDDARADILPYASFPYKNARALHHGPVATWREWMKDYLGVEPIPPEGPDWGPSFSGNTQAHTLPPVLMNPSFRPVRG